MTQQELKELLHYNQDTGIFTWIAKNKIAGGINSQGYVAIKIKNKIYKAHRLAWLYVHGVWPSIVDHINRIKNDNKLSNLRLATQSENQFNSNLRKDNTSGIKGITWHKPAKKWLVQIRINKKKTYIGIYEDFEMARIAIDLARKKYHKEFAN
jgi:hypothetical protein